jgi:hypothetical protein
MSERSETTETTETPVEEPAAGQATTTGEATATGTPTPTEEPAPEGRAAERVAGEQPEDRWTHFAPEPPGPPGRFARVAARVGRFLSHEWTLVALGALALAAAMNWQCVIHPATTIPMDLGDPLLQAWQMAWAGHAITTDPGGLWQANTFFPDGYSFAFSDTLLGYLPASVLGSGPTAALVRYNVMFVLLQALAFIGPYALVRQLGAGRTAAAVAGAAFAYAPWRWGQAGHMHVLSNGGLALALAMLARGHGYKLTGGFRRERTRPGWVVAGWAVAAWQISLGFGIGLPFAYLMGAACLVVGVRWLVRWRRGRPVPGERILQADALGIVVFGAVSGLMAWPYLKVLQLHPEARRTDSDLHTFSPMLRAFVTAPAQSLLWGRAHEAARATMAAPAETTLLPGFFLIGLAVAGLVFSVWSLRIRLWLLGGVVGSLILAMGTQFFGGVLYLPLFRWLPGWAAIRTPGRLTVWMTLGLVVLAAGAVGALVERAGEVAAERKPARPHPLMRLATLLPLVLVLVEGINIVQHPVVPKAPAGFTAASGPVLVLPSDTKFDFFPMIWSTGRFPKIVNGVSGFTPKDQQAVRDVTKFFPDTASVDYLRRIGVRSVVVVKAQAGPHYARAAQPDQAAADLGITWKDYGDTIVYTLS